MEEQTIKLTLDFPPYTNNLYRNLKLKTGVTIRVKTGAAKKYDKAVEKVCKAAQIKPFTSDVDVRLRVYRPRRVGDLDGTFKAVFDSLKGFAYEDDKQIVGIVARRLDDKNRPRVEIEISAASGSEQTLF